MDLLLFCWSTEEIQINVIFGETLLFTWQQLMAISTVCPFWCLLVPMCGAWTMTTTRHWTWQPLGVTWTVCDIWTLSLPNRSPSPQTGEANWRTVPSVMQRNALRTVKSFSASITNAWRSISWERVLQWTCRIRWVTAVSAAPWVEGSLSSTPSTPTWHTRRYCAWTSQVY